MHTKKAKVGEQIIATQSLTPLKLHDWQISHVAFVAQFVAFGLLVFQFDNFPKIEPIGNLSQLVKIVPIFKYGCD